MIIEDSTKLIQRLQEIKKTGQFTPEALELIDSYSRNNCNPNFHDWLFETYLPNLDISEYMILSDDWDDIDRNLINMAHYKFIYPLLSQ